MLIIDAHCHAGEGDGLDGPWNTRADLSAYMEQTRDYGIQQTVIFPAFHTDYSKANRLVWEITKRHPRKFYGFAFVHAEKDKGRIFSMVKKAVVDYGFRGIKVHRHDAPLSREICEVAQKLKVPILYDVVGKVETIELFATEYRQVNFIIPHLGTFADHWNTQLAFIPLLERHPNVYTDTSGVRRFDLLSMAVKQAGAHKIIFGSDGPWLHPGVELEKIYALQLSDKELKQVLSGNILRLMRIKR